MHVCVFSLIVGKLQELNLVPKLKDNMIAEEMKSLHIFSEQKQYAGCER